MGQSWKIVNIDKMESWDGGTMGEFIYYTNPALLRCLVSLPTAEDEIVGCWAGDRIVCIGEGTIDLPSDVFTDDDQALIDKLLEDECSDAADSEDNEELGRRLYKKATPITDKLRYDYLLRSPADICPPNSVWALRNLTLKEFILSDKVISGSELYWKDDFHDPFEDFPGLFQVLVMNIGWSSDPSCDMVYNTPEYTPPDGEKAPMDEGAWAGYRIDIVMVTDGAVQLKSEGWTDVSFGTFRQMRDVFNAEGVTF